MPTNWWPSYPGMANSIIDPGHGLGMNASRYTSSLTTMPLAIAHRTNLLALPRLSSKLPSQSIVFLLPLFSLLEYRDTAQSE
jgi:hypothetical protein